jgi:hypothetical protein
MEWIPTKCGASECNREAAIMRRPWPKRGCCNMGKKEKLVNIFVIESITLETLGCCSSSIIGKIFSSYEVLVSTFLYNHIHSLSQILYVLLI